MFEIFLASFTSSVVILGIGYFFSLVFFSRSFLRTLYLSEIGIYGIIFLSFLGLLINFFYQLDKNVGTLIVIFGFLSFIYFKGYNKLTFLFITAFITFILIYYANVNRPDAGLYHLPVISMINDSKIIIGSSNIHFRFAHSSIIQYLSALNNNYLFSTSSITIPSATIFSFCIFYFFENYKNSINEKDKGLSLIHFFIIIFSLYSFNRYSSYGNDVSAHLLYFTLVIKLISYTSLTKIRINDFYSISLLSLFLFANKLFMGIVLIIPLILFFLSKEKIEIIKTKNFVICFFLFSLWVTKSILTSGCVLYPVNKTCFKNLKIYDENKTTIEAQSGEAWSKDWVNQSSDIMEFQDYNRDFNWLYTWTNNHFKKILEKLGPFIGFLFLIFILLIFGRGNKRDKNKNQPIYMKQYHLVLIISVSFTIIWFVKFPIYRYGMSFIAISLIFLFYKLFIKNLYLTDFNKLKKIFNTILIISIFGFCLKNGLRIKDKFENNTKNAWPDIYSEKGDFNKNNFMQIKKDNKIMYYFSEGKLCMYSKAPCSNYLIKNLNIDIKKGYNIFWID